jgi:hypothetical protein
VDWIYLAERAVQSEYDNESQVSAKTEEFLSTRLLVSVHEAFSFFYWRYNPLWVCILQPSSGL